MKRLLFILILLAVVGSSRAQQKTFLPATPQDVVMYQVNPRVFASRQSLKAVTQHLDSIKALGANTIWVMPVFPIGTTKSKNSPYSISDYKAVAPEFGTIDDYKQLVAQAHRRGMAVIQDWVANHTSWDHPWIKAHPDWYTHDATTDTIICPQGPGWDWTDVADLNYDSQKLRAAMTGEMLFWIEQVGIDGFRCDVADGVPADYWHDAIRQLRKAAAPRKILMLAEGKRPDNFTVGGFDMNYAWEYKDSLVSVFTKGQPANHLFSADSAEYEPLPAGKVKMRFITNHDQSAQVSPIKEFGGLRAAMAAFVAATYLHGGALIYSSQELAYPKAINFFHYVPVNWRSQPQIYKEYCRLMSLYNSHAAFRQGNYKAYPDRDILMFEKNSGDKRYLIAVNVRNKVCTVNVPNEWRGRVTDLYYGKSATLSSQLRMLPFEYKIMVKR